MQFCTVLPDDFRAGRSRPLIPTGFAYGQPTDELPVLYVKFTIKYMRSDKVPEQYRYLYAVPVLCKEKMN